jgi:chemotaxis signal transduction protein
MIDELEEHRQRLAHAFDLAFSEPFSSEQHELCDFLVFRLGAHRYALPVGELAGVQNKKTIQSLPDAPPHCLGLAGVRGRVGAVYDLGALLGSKASERLCWFLQTKADPEVALLVPKPDRYLRVPLASIAYGVGVEGATVGVVSEGGAGINVLSVDRIVQGIRGGKGTAP